MDLHFPDELQEPVFQRESMLSEKLLAAANESRSGMRRLRWLKMFGLLGVVYMPLQIVLGQKYEGILALCRRTGQLLWRQQVSVSPECFFWLNKDDIPHTSIQVHPDYMVLKSNLQNFLIPVPLPQLEPLWALSNLCSSSRSYLSRLPPDVRKLVEVQLKTEHSCSLLFWNGTEAVWMRDARAYGPPLAPSHPSTANSPAGALAWPLYAPPPVERKAFHSDMLVGSALVMPLADYGIVLSVGTGNRYL
jgi:hypothetical protein